MAACHAKPRSPEITQGSRERRPADKKREIPRQFPLNSVCQSEVKPSHKSWLAASGALLSNLVLSEINGHANMAGKMTTLNLNGYNDPQVQKNLGGDYLRS
ncbi:hypothetical protein CEXT_330141 [Caerostris extrusa]|uniref:Uncharacterized protein n=1 Tax=Caerostris extrusa TaxID=172846 RepID=A0AAV4TZ75_CAEEX|nr:hypothetical protein CEXT_330141 [Caerostris extrusa]